MAEGDGPGTDNEIPPEGFPPDEVGFFTDTLAMDGALIDEAESIVQSVNVIDEIISTDYKIYSAEYADIANSVFTQVQMDILSDDLQVGDVNQFFRVWLPAHGVTVITAAVITAGLFAALLWSYEVNREPSLQRTATRPPAKTVTQVPPAGTTHHATPSTPVRTPSGTITVPTVPDLGTTPGDRLVEAAAKDVQPIRVTVPGLSRAEAKGISLAIAHAYEDELKILAQIVDGLLNGGAGGRTAVTVRTMNNTLASLRAAIAQIERQIDSVNSQQLQALVLEALADIHALQSEITHVPGYGTHINLATLQALINADTAAIKRLQIKITPLPGVVHLVRGISSPSLLQKIISLTASLAGYTKLSVFKSFETKTDGDINKLTRQMMQMEDCCTENSNVTKPITAGGATPGLLKQLGGILKLAAEIGFAATIIDIAASVFDLNVALQNTIDGSAKVAPWAAAAMAKVPKDIEFWNQFHYAA